MILWVITKAIRREEAGNPRLVVSGYDPLDINQLSTGYIGSINKVALSLQMNQCKKSDRPKRNLLEG